MNNNENIERKSLTLSVTNRKRK